MDSVCSVICLCQTIVITLLCTSSIRVMCVLIYDDEQATTGYTDFLPTQPSSELWSTCEYVMSRLPGISGTSTFSHMSSSVSLQSSLMGMTLGFESRISKSPSRLLALRRCLEGKICAASKRENVVLDDTGAKTSDASYSSAS